MSEPQPPAPSQYVIIKDEGNGLGIAGFICSLLGLLFTGGLLCPVGLIISLIALGRSPRGFATAGLILGLIGTCGWGVIIVVGGLALVATVFALIAAAAGVYMLFQAEQVEITADMVRMTIAVEQYKRDNDDVVPAELSLLMLEESILLDPWGTRYQYHLVDRDPGFEIISAGRDKQFGTADDVSLSKLDQAWEDASKDFHRKMQELNKRGGFEIDPEDWRHPPPPPDSTPPGPTPAPALPDAEAPPPDEPVFTPQPGAPVEAPNPPSPSTEDSTEAGIPEQSPR